MVEIVEWNDAWMMGHWHTADDWEASPHKVTSVGWVVAENDTVVVLAQTTTEDETIGNTVAIPKGMIVRRTPVEL